MRRRDLLRHGVCASAGAFVSGLADTNNPPRSLETYVDPLPVPPIIRPAAHRGVVEVRMRPFRHNVHRDLAPATLWGYNGMWPGPTFEVRRGQPLASQMDERTADQTFPAIDSTIHGSEKHVPEVRTVTHVHGAQVLPESDGYPDAWYTADGKTAHCHRRQHEPLSQRPGRHPALVSRSRSRHHSPECLRRPGWLLRDPRRRGRRAQPSQRPYEIPLMIQDRKFGPMARSSIRLPQNGTHPVWMQEFFGDTICVNGKALRIWKSSRASTVSGW